MTDAQSRTSGDHAYIAELEAEIERPRAALATQAEPDAEAQKHRTPYRQDPDYQDWLNELMENAGDEWDGDDAMEAIALRYVRHLEAVAAPAAPQEDT